MILNATINSLTLGAGTQYTITAADGFASPQVDFNKYPLGGKNGIRVNKTLWRERVLRLEIGVRADTPINYETLRSNLIQAFDLPTLGESTFYFTTLGGRQLQCDVLLNAPIDAPFIRGQITVGKFRVELLVQDSFFYGQTLNSTIINPPTTGGTTLPTTLPFSFSLSGGSSIIVNNGNGVMYPVVRIYGDSTNAHLSNSTTGQEFSIQTNIPAGVYVEIDMLEQSAIGSDGLNYLEYFEGDFFYLKPNSNTLNYSSDSGAGSGTYAQVFYRDAVTGI